MVNRESLNRQNPQMTLKPVPIFWSIQGDSIYRHHNEPRFRLYVPKQETFPIPLEYIDVTRFYWYRCGCVTREADGRLLESMIASALKKLLNTQIHFRKRVSVEEQRAQKHDRFLRGR